MADTPAERARRSRRHKAGDHSLCVPERCIDVTPGVTRDKPQVSASREATLGPAGRAVWDEAVGTTKLPALQAALTLEFCRLVDRAEKLDEQIRGEDESWLRVVDPNEDGGDLVVTIDKPLSEARQTATAMKQIFNELRQADARAGGRSPGKPAAPSKPDAPAPGAGGRLVALVNARVSERGGTAAG